MTVLAHRVRRRLVARAVSSCATLATAVTSAPNLRASPVAGLGTPQESVAEPSRVSKSAPAKQSREERVRFPSGKAVKDARGI